MPANLVRVFLDTCVRHGARPAVVDGNRILTYGALEARSRAVAAALAARGVGRGDRVGVRLERGADACAVMLGVMRAGAAYVPCDPAFPEGRVREIFRDARVICVVETGANGDVPSFTPEFLQETGSGRAAPEVEIGEEDSAYLIFTSGSTGRPKGVVVPHHAVCAFVEGEHKFFDIIPEDRVAHGFSLAFDAAVEELWLAWRHGATLVCAPTETARSPSVMPEFLVKNRVTVWSTVPTFLAAVEADLPSLRLLIVGGEACPEDLVRRHARLGVRMANTYGPTETAVVATAEFLEYGKPVRIGCPLSGYTAFVADTDGRPVADGAPGELWIGGVGVASGYWERPDLTAEKFVSSNHAGGGRFYRTGDLVERDTDGAFRFLGRIDDQVKLRGYRVELGEIENRLMELPGVTGAAARVCREDDGGDWLAGYVVAGPDFDERVARGLLREKLPVYMVPARIVALASLPTLVSGKTDRAKLPKPESSAADVAPDAEAALSSTERCVRELWRGLLPGVPVVRGTDFFESGGHSLVAAKLVSKLRAEPEFSGVSVTDVYSHTTLAAFAARLDELSAESSKHAGAVKSTRRADPELPKRHFLCGLAQFFALYPLFAISAPAWIFAWAVYHLFVLHENEAQVTFLVLAGAAAMLGFGPVRMAFAVMVKWLVLGRVTPGRRKLWGFWYFRFWFVSRVIAAAATGSMRGTPWMNVYLRLLGAKVAKNAHIETTFVGVPDLLEVGEGASLGHDASLLGHTVEDGEIIVGRIRVGRRACIGAKCLFSPDTALGDDAELADGTLLTPGQSVPAGEVWEGAPARRVGFTDGNREQDDSAGPLLLKPAFALSHLGLSIIPALAAMPGAWLLGYADAEHCDFYEGYGDLWKLAVAAVPAAALYALSLAFWIVAAKWLLLGRVKSGAYRLRSWRRLRHWFVESLMHLSLDTLFPFFATVYTPTWLRLLGAKIGPWTEVSTAENMNPDLLRLGSGVFVADAVCLGASRVRDGVVRLDTVEVGDNTFLGNNGVAPGGVRLGPDGLVGVLSKAPAFREAREPGRSWLGLPAFPLPRRQESADFGAHLTRRPSYGLFLSRSFVEFWRIVLPGTLTGFFAFVLFLIADDLIAEERVGYGGLVFLFPVLLLVLGAVLTTVAILLKWLVARRQRPAEFPLWSFGVWRAEFAAAMHEHVAVSALVGTLLGTPFAPWYFRLLGAKFGRRVFCETIYLTEFDLVEVGDDAALNYGCDLQTHLFEDRVLKMSRVKVGRGASLGAFSVTLYDAEVAEGAKLAGLSLVMKGEVATSGATWAGVPAKRVAGEGIGA